MGRSGDFRSNGPILPIEFSRVSKDGRVTLVIDPTAAEIQTHWIPLRASTYMEAVSELGIREKIEPAMWLRWVGLETRAGDTFRQGESDSRVRRSIETWLERQTLDGVVWTALPFRGPNGEAERPSCDRLLDHLNSLEGEARRRAEEYIRRAPESVRTSNRNRFEASLGWTPWAGGD